MEMQGWSYGLDSLHDMIIPGVIHYSDVRTTTGDTDPISIACISLSGSGVAPDHRWTQFMILSIVRHWHGGTSAQTIIGGTRVY